MDLITYIINTLNSIEIKGRDNLTKMLGCISALEELQKTIAKEVDADGRQANISAD